MSKDRRLRALREQLDEAGLRGSFLVRDLATGEQVGIEPGTPYAVASIAKVPLAMAVLDRVRRGELDPAERLEVGPGVPELQERPGPPGLGRFRHPALVAVDDLLYLAVALSDSTAADALFRLVPPADVASYLRETGLDGITVRHPVAELTGTPAERLNADEAHLALRLAIEEGTAGGGHAIAQLDTSRASTATATALVDLLAALWTPSRVDPDVAERVRALMGLNVLRQRLAPDFASDAARWSSKTGTLLHQRHECGVVEHADGGAYAVAALTESRVAASVQPQAEATMGAVARALHDLLRAG